ncbi:hypothetical protein DFP72DRAFT_1039536 [Ephemerocybe angulata]|uniref:Uncharacterized protein n=1 Tax=Ephemerocybe angulata TaxID=980116 RepID=A0A8H6MH60_9AGAR|nr:hypothetical protein DFP72DRAFT_1039536 [Tulosesus angulatus]
MRPPRCAQPVASESHPRKHTPIQAFEQVPQGTTATSEKTRPIEYKKAQEQVRNFYPAMMEPRVEGEKGDIAGVRRGRRRRLWVQGAAPTKVAAQTKDSGPGTAGCGCSARGRGTKNSEPIAEEGIGPAEGEMRQRQNLGCALVHHGGSLDHAVIPNLTIHVGERRFEAEVQSEHYLKVSLKRSGRNVVMIVYAEIEEGHEAGYTRLRISEVVGVILVDVDVAKAARTRASLRHAVVDRKVIVVVDGRCRVFVERFFNQGRRSVEIPSCRPRALRAAYNQRFRTAEYGAAYYQVRPYPKLFVSDEKPRQIAVEVVNIRSA